MSASNVRGNVVSLRLVLGHSTCTRIIIIISIHVILAISAVCGSTTSNIRLDCKEDNNGDFKWVAIFETCVCSDEQAIFVARGFVYDEDCNKPMKANDSIFKKIKKACNGKTECDISQFDTSLCDTHRCMRVAFACNSTDDDNNSIKPNIRRGNTKGNGDIKAECNHTANGLSTEATTDSRDTSTGISGEHMGPNESVNNDSDSLDMKVVIIVVVSVVSFVAAVIAVTLCLLFFCCQKSPLYRGSVMVRRHRQQQNQGEYDYVDERNIQDLISSPEDRTHLRGVFCVDPQHSSTSRDYQNTITSEYQHYEGISPNESPDPSNRTSLSSQPNLSVSIIPVTPKLLKSAPSSSGSPQPVDRYNTAQTHPVNAEDVVFGRQGHLTTEDLQHDIYSVASPQTCSSRAGAAKYLNMLSVTGDYAHLTRPGEDTQAMDNVYDG